MKSYLASFATVLGIWALVWVPIYGAWTLGSRSVWPVGPNYRITAGAGDEHRTWDVRTWSYACWTDSDSIKFRDPLTMREIIVSGPYVIEELRP